MLPWPVRGAAKCLRALCLWKWQQRYADRAPYQSADEQNLDGLKLGVGGEGEKVQPKNRADKHTLRGGAGCPDADTGSCVDHVRACSALSVCLNAVRLSAVARISQASFGRSLRTDSSGLMRCTSCILCHGVASAYDTCVCAGRMASGEQLTHAEGVASTSSLSGCFPISAAIKIDCLLPAEGAC